MVGAALPSGGLTRSILSSITVEKALLVGWTEVEETRRRDCSAVRGTGLRAIAAMVEAGGIELTLPLLLWPVNKNDQAAT